MFVCYTGLVKTKVSLPCVYTSKNEKHNSCGVIDNRIPVYKAIRRHHINVNEDAQMLRITQLRTVLNSAKNKQRL